MTGAGPVDASQHVAPAPVAREISVRMRGASAVVGGKTVWSDVSLDLAAGEFVAVLGPNGCGKSTLLKVLLGLTPSHGMVEVLGARPGRRNKLIGNLPQRRAFDASVRIRGVDVVSLGLDGARWGTPVPGLARVLAPRRSAQRRRRLEHVIEVVGAADYARRPIGRCSGGEQQRLLIAQALIRQPELLLLDEPLDSLDVPSQAGISALVGDICRREGVTVLMVAHDVNPVLPYLDRVIYIARGSAVIGTPEEVITADQLSALYGVPIEVLHDRAGHLFVVGQPGVRPTQIAGARA
ncbi:metal ABC transporter ATP-binding protein [Mycobacterium montefiorense]|uniref:ABC transporter ATP-binding protein n=1 Tax=Mycobacterium montefiorense TaxID=154654 RepID=A0AA37PKY3_9MYCO|nr:ATP-binding cassette domain-containing protein [Mycobacterium montefiorense]GBG36390.1 ABC transporter ATP-binding protein [Mycobacterium montefiorense]GKU37129.1 ABC transporter ATP-binding protein [Mycobacterium montefiorense]GKU43355.1 ABC transporter ATP-binding protein [Mycobacterium montefiorense]GKU43911.1 ABC transporter ATP-binding protein [Mycobacterium montefiorense]GKU53670.1 ABC transporter ATP-binding protein [Mycobacterium montefiorense]